MEDPRKVPPSCLRRALGPFPRVFAAEAVAAEFQTPAERPKLPPSIPESHYPESGWDLLRELFIKDDQQRTSEELQNICKAAVSAGIIGFVYGGVPAFVHAKQCYVEQSQADIYHNRFDAVQAAHCAATRAFIRYGWRWRWRTAAFMTTFNSVTTGLNVYRNKNALSHFVIAGAVTGSLFRINLGLRGLMAGGIIGALLGTPIRSLLMLLQRYCGETVQQRKEKDHKVLHERQLEEWKAKLQITEFLPEEIASGLQQNQSEDDARKIEAPLSLLRNPSTTDKQDKD
ncbi:complex I assembly factor TIMMDC1, mitochondrial-like [Echinops telfairi]|uniref:Complex I assembly factor TIMMDC1, mitochondrial-like n=1 Tax=Echinops telfairi TaxID=9371 RepID=A0AC55D1A6_ECHTE|nr:complex I assembly factor TIMMDC1, mitochondrial-like [Echinops telfairi]